MFDTESNSEQENERPLYANSRAVLMGDGMQLWSCGFRSCFDEKGVQILEQIFSPTAEDACRRLMQEADPGNVWDIGSPEFASEELVCFPTGSGPATIQVYRVHRRVEYRVELLPTAVNA